MYVCVMGARSYHSMAGNETAEEVHHRRISHSMGHHSSVRLTRFTRRKRGFESGYGGEVITRAAVAQTLHLQFIGNDRVCSNDSS